MYRFSMFRCGLVLVVLALVVAPRVGFGADSTFVGVLAVAVQEEHAKRLGLSDEVREKLQTLIDRREREALGIALQIKDLPPPEIAARLAPFVKESERQGLELLTVEQRSRLDQLRIAAAGMQSLEDPEVRQVLGLTAAQQQEVEKLLQQRSQDLMQGGESERRITRNVYERKLSAVLTDVQRTTWQKLAGLGAVPTAPATAAPPTAAAPAMGGQGAPAPSAPAPSAPAAAATPNPVASNGAAVAPGASPAAAATAGKPAEADAKMPSASGIAGSGSVEELKLQFNFTYHPWEDVLEWFASQADLSLQIEYPPPGTFNYRDTRYYTPAQAIDIMNRVLLTKGFTLVRTGRLLTLVNLEEEIPPQLVELVAVSDLEERGEFEIVKCLFQLAKWEPAQAAEEITKLVGRGGSVSALPRARQVMVTDTVGKLREIRRMIESVENPSGVNASIIPIVLQHVTPEELLAVARPLLGLPADQNTNDQIKIAVDAFSRRLFVTGNRETVQRLEELVPLVDRAPQAAEGPVVALEQPQLATYAITKADSAQVLAVMQTLLAGLPDVRLAVDPLTKKLIALARPAEHRTIVETLRQLEGDVERVEVISLRRLDPQLVILAINKLFGTSADSTEGPKVDGDPNAMKLWVRGTDAQIAQVRDLVEKLEGSDPTAAAGVRGNVRVLPYSGNTASAAVRNAELIWNSMRPNKLRMVTPSGISSALRESTPARPSDAEGNSEGASNLDRVRSPGAMRPTAPLSEPPQSGAGPAAAESPAAPSAPEAAPAAVPAAPPTVPAPAAPTSASSDSQNRSAGRVERASSGVPAVSPNRIADAARRSIPFGLNSQTRTQDTFQFVRQQNGGEVGATATPATALADTPANSGHTLPSSQAPVAAEIVITFTSNGIIVASEDLAALDEFESLVKTLLESSSVAPQEPTIFWLKFAKAEVAAELLTRIVTGASSGEGGGGSLVGDVASSVLGNVGGGLLGSLLGGADSLIPSGAPSIVPDVRLNCLIVQASPTDLALIEQLLPVIDREAGPESVETAGKPRLLPVYFMTADEMGNIVKQVFADRIATAAGDRQARQPSPEDFIRALRGGGGGGGGGGRSGGGESAGEVSKMTIGVDNRSNSLIVSAPEPLFREVEALVNQLDREGLESDDGVAVVAIKQSNPTSVQKALAAIVGNSVKTSSNPSSSSSTSTPSASSSSSSPTNNASNNDADAIRRRIEFFRSLQQGGGFGGGGVGRGDSGRGGGGGGRGGRGR